MGARAVAVAVDVEHDGAVEEPVEHGAGDVGVVEDVAPLTDTEVGGECDRTPFCWAHLMLPLKYRWLMTWKRAAAASDASGKYPTSSMINKRGPAKNCMVVTQQPSSAAR